MSSPVLDLALSRRMLRSKIHRLVVTHACPDYEGSLTLPPELMAVADIVEFEAVSVWNVTQGTRFETYAILGAAQSTDVCVNGAAAHLANPGDIIIVATFCDLPEPMVKDFRPKLVFVDSNNRFLESRPEIPGPRSYPKVSSTGSAKH